MTAPATHPTILDRRSAASRKAARTCALLHRSAAATCACGAARRPGGHDCRACHAQAERARRAAVPRLGMAFPVEAAICGLLGAAS